MKDIVITEVKVDEFGNIKIRDKYVKKWTNADYLTYKGKRLTTLTEIKNEVIRRVQLHDFKLVADTGVGKYYRLLLFDSDDIILVVSMKKEEDDEKSNKSN